MTLLGDAGIGGPFTELLMQELPKSLSFEGFTVNIRVVEMGTNPLCESVSVEFELAVTGDTATNEQRGVRKIWSSEAVLSFTFSATSSIKDNLSEFLQFVSDHASTAVTAPQVTRSTAQRRTG
jgi:hypothetical protein